MTSSRARRAVFTTLLVSAALWLGPAGCGSDAAVDPVPGWRAQGAAVLAQAVLAQAGCDNHAMTCPGAKAPTTQLPDFNPASPRFGETYAFSELDDHPKVVALLAGW